MIFQLNKSDIDLLNKFKLILKLKNLNFNFHLSKNDLSQFNIIHDTDIKIIHNINNIYIDDVFIYDNDINNTIMELYNYHIYIKGYELTSLIIKFFKLKIKKDNSINVHYDNLNLYFKLFIDILNKALYNNII